MKRENFCAHCMDYCVYAAFSGTVSCNDSLQVQPKAGYILGRYEQDEFTLKLVVKVIQTKGKSILVQAWTRVWGSRRLRFPIFIDNRTNEGGKVDSPKHRPPLHPQEIYQVFILLEDESTRGPQFGRKDYVNKKFQ